MDRTTECRDFNTIMKLLMTTAMTLAILLATALWIQPSYAAVDIAAGNYDGVPWRITSDWELIIGLEGEVFTFANNQEREMTDYPWGHTSNNYYKSIKKVTFEGTVIGSGSFSRMFYECGNIESFDLSGLQTGAVTDMSEMFSGCTKIHTLDVTGFDTSQVTDMYGLFKDCTSLNTLDVTGFDTSNVESMSSMFSRCTSLTSLDVTGFDTANVKSMDNMFTACVCLGSLDVSGFKTSKVRIMSGMFLNCEIIKELDLSNFDTSNVEYMDEMFSCCSSLADLDLSSFDTSKVRGMTLMFENCYSLTSLDLSHFNTGKLYEALGMFTRSGIVELDLSGWDISGLAYMEDMFDGCDSLEWLRLGNWSYEWWEDEDEDDFLEQVPRFPVAMVNEADISEEYAPGTPIPKCNGVTFVSDKYGGPGYAVTEEMMYGEYVEYLDNRTYENVSLHLYDTMADVLGRKNDSDDRLAKIKSAMHDGVISSCIDIIKEMTGKYQSEIQKELAAKLLQSMSSSPDIAELAGLEYAKTFSKVPKKILSILETSGELSNSDIAVIAKWLAPKNAKHRSQIKKNIKVLKKNSEAFEKATKVFKAAGFTVTVSDVVISTYMMYESDRELVDRLMDTISPDTDLYKGLEQIHTSQEAGFTMSVCLDLIDKLGQKQFASLLEDAGVTITDVMLHKLVKTTTGKALPTALSTYTMIADVFYWGVSYLLPGPDQEELATAIMSISNVGTINYEARKLRQEMQNQWKKEGKEASEKQRSDYALLMEAYHYVMLNCAEDVSACGTSADKDIIRNAFRIAGDKLAYKDYMKSCRYNANTDFTTSSSGSGVVITGVGQRTSKRMNLNVDGGAQKRAIDKSVLIDIPEIIDGQEVVGIESEAFAGMTDISSIWLPESVEMIGDDAFRGCTSLKCVYGGKGLKSIGTGAFADCDNLEEFDMIETVTEIGDDAFANDSKLKIVSGGTIAEQYAADNGIVFEQRSKYVSEIVVMDEPTKKVYNMYEPIDRTGLKVGVRYIGDDLNVVPVDDYSCFFYEPRHIGENTLVVMYGDKIAYITVEVTDDDSEYNVRYVDLYGNEIADMTSGMAAGGSTITLEAPAIEGYVPLEQTKDFLIGEVNDFEFVYQSKSELIVPVSLSKAVVKGVSTKTWTGKELTQNITVTVNGESLIRDIDYTVSYSNNKNVGKATIKLTGLVDYKGTLSKTFVINPKGTSLSKVTAGKKAFTAKWKKQSSQTSGYQVRYSLKSNMSKATTKTVKGSKKTSLTIKKLKAKKKYYVQIRTYKTVGSKKYYSAWSKKKTVKTK